ncbi:conserved hypothetical protein [Candidatus Terasakiella magnetica]|uniref:Uncharacterized protein n=1 Tax=Candidatus Terasakiella magnetica TaxID=1867952 RepID=A0A1C3RHP9_9PROT|nr:hypothetical protein [Candidatus Terasakiella magnetica]SCA56813.1 conserved hypothetical protein [Candidatus Terasakiella magnetica]
MTKSSRKDAAKIFQALHNYDHLMGPPDEAAQKVAFSELFAYAHDPNHTSSPVLQAALLNDLKLRRGLKRLLEKQSIVHMARAAAASTGDIDIREADGFKISLKPSKADASQIYLLIEAIDRDETPSLLFINQEDGPILRLVIDDFYDGEAQILLSSDDDIVKALRNVKSEVILS